MVRSFKNAKSQLLYNNDKYHVWQSNLHHECGVFEKISWAPTVDVHGRVERPNLYFHGSPPVAILTSYHYMQTRIEDTQNLRQQNDKILFIPGFQWRCTSKAIRVRASKGSNYSCLWGASSKEHQNLEYTFNISNPSLEERIKILKGGYYGKTFP